MFSPKFAWNDYFTGSSATTLNSGPYSSRETPSVSSVYVSNCLFNKCTVASDNGGALYCYTSVTYLFVESASFFSCKTNSGSGGAIYFYNSNGLHCVMYEVCGNDCCSTSLGPFAHISINNAASNMNYVNYTSIVRCVNDTTNSQETLRLDYGKIHCPSVNISLNKCVNRPGIVCTPFTDSSSVICSLSFSTFADNNAPRCGCIWCNRDGAKYEIKCCNILRNTQGTDLYGIIFARGNLSNLCFISRIFFLFNHTL
jgi:hypothetical protein